VGFSLGAPVVIEAANKEPDQVIGVVLVDDLKEVEMKIRPPMAQYLDSMYMDLINNPTKEKLVNGGFFKNNVDSAFHRAVLSLEGASHIGWRESLAGYIKWRNEHCTNSIKTVKAPIIAINSDLQPTNIEAFRKYVPTFKAYIVGNVGHLIMWDNIDEFNRLLEVSIQEFISE
jgi:pimeloyl-ACP methyl ester carboxylesterase